MRMIFVNLPVSDVPATRAFWSELGFTFNEMFSSDDSLCVVLEENICAMLMTPTKFAGFVNGDIADAHSTTEVLLCLSCESRQEVDDLLARAIDAGGKPWKPVMDAGPMYGASFTDPDGHVWELMHMDLSALPDAAPAG